MNQRPINPLLKPSSDRARSLPGEDDGSDSAPSDDNDDFDYVDDIETEEAEEQYPLKRHQRNHSLNKDSAESPGITRLSSEPSACKHPGLASQESNLESELIPVQGFLRFATLQIQEGRLLFGIFANALLILCLPLGRWRHLGRLGGRTILHRGARFSQKEDAFIVELKKNLGWDVIEDKFAQRFPYRSKSSLQVSFE